MIIVINSQGGLASIQDEDLFQGSTQLNTINLIAPFADSVTFKAMFEMPDGTYLPDNLDGYVLQPSMKIADGLNTWKLPITFPITQNYGVVTMQLRGMIGDTVACTTRIQLPIQKGVPYASGFEEISDKDQLLQMIADLRALINNKVDTVNYSYGQADNIDEFTVGVYYVYDTIEGKFVPKTLPQDYVAGTTYYKVKNIGRVVNINQGLYFEYADTDTNTTMRLKIEKDKATLNDKQIVVFDDLKADNINYDNRLSDIPADNVKDALDNLKDRIDNIETSQILDLGDLVISSANWEQAEDGSFTYKFKHDDFKNSTTQAIIFTPDDDAIDNLNNNDILLYPAVELGQESENIAYAILRTSKRPGFLINVHCTLQSVALSSHTSCLKAYQVKFAETENIQQNNVQSAIEQVQTNLETKSTLLQNNINVVDNKLIKTKTYHNTTLADHINEIMKYGSKNENGGLVNLKLKFAGSTGIKGTMSKCEITANGVTFNIEDNVPILDTIITTYTFTPTGYYTDSNSNTLYLSSTTFTQDFATSPAITATITNSGATVYFEYSHSTSSKAKIYTSEIGIRDLTLKDLIITYYDYAQEENV